MFGYWTPMFRNLTWYMAPEHIHKVTAKLYLETCLHSNILNTDIRVYILCQDQLGHTFAYLYFVLCVLFFPNMITLEEGILDVMTILSFTFILLEHFLSFKMTSFSLTLISAIRCYEWNTAENSLLFSLFFAVCFYLFLENISAAKYPLSVCCITNMKIKFNFVWRNKQTNKQTRTTPKTNTKSHSAYSTSLLTCNNLYDAINLTSDEVSMQIVRYCISYYLLNIN